MALKLRKEPTVIMWETLQPSLTNLVMLRVTINELKKSCSSISSASPPGSNSWSKNLETPEKLSKFARTSHSKALSSVSSATTNQLPKPQLSAGSCCSCIPSISQCQLCTGRLHMPKLLGATRAVFNENHSSEENLMKTIENPPSAKPGERVSLRGASYLDVSLRRSYPLSMLRKPSTWKKKANISQFPSVRLRDRNPISTGM